MRCSITIGLVLAVVSLVGVAPALACGGYGLSGEILRAASSEAVEPALVERLRGGGQSAIDQLARLRDGLAARRDKLRAAPEPTKETAGEIDALAVRIARVERLMDEVGQQKYCSRSRLFWHTDLDAAKAAARASGKPILSLRMLGNLDEEFSCANSRFFRTTLYANTEISRLLREDFVLHWKSVRPVPKVTIDFGDGRKLERTLTGNSMHYILTPEGEVVEALPGLYGPRAFLRKVNEGLSLVRRIGPLSASERAAAIAEHHAGRFAELDREFARDLAKVQPAAASRAALDQPADQAAVLPRAVAANELARPKGRVERPLVAAALPTAATPDQLTDEGLWQAIAALHAGDAELDEASREVIRGQNPTAAAAGRLAITKRLVEDPLVRLVRSLQESIALDTVRNEYQLHRRIHSWLAEAAYRPDVETLNERVYAEVFLTPSSDPWLGLAPADVYTALPEGGVVGSGRVR